MVPRCDRRSGRVDLRLRFILAEGTIPPRFRSAAGALRRHPQRDESEPAHACLAQERPFQGRLHEHAFSRFIDPARRVGGAEPRNACLHIYSSMRLYGPAAIALEDDDYTALYERAARMESVSYEGLLPNETLKEQLRSIDILAYPCTFAETSCLSAIEAMSAGCRVICPAIGALPETTFDFARLYFPAADAQSHAALFERELQAELADPWGGRPASAMAPTGMVPRRLRLGQTHRGVATPHRTPAWNLAVRDRQMTMDDQSCVISAHCYSYNRGGINNQKLALYGLYLQSVRKSPHRLVLPHLLRFDQVTFQHTRAPLSQYFDTRFLLDLAAAHHVEVLDVEPRGDEGGWDYFHHGNNHIPFAGARERADRGRLDVSLLPIPGAEGLQSACSTKGRGMRYSGDDPSDWRCNFESRRIGCFISTTG